MDFLKEFLSSDLFDAVAKELEGKNVSLINNFGGEYALKSELLAENEQKISKIMFDNALKSELEKCGAKSIKALEGFLEPDKMSLEGGVLKGFEEQITKIKKENGFLFNDALAITGHSHKSGMTDFNSMSDDEYYQSVFRKDEF
ncbi:MAG: phage scaffolding protein [Clostridia bacterium]|nr:phage scaffolding protein [Clostridia bacterium]